MPEVGVLELQVRDNAKTAGTGLESLAGAITAVKTAVGKGLGLGTVGTQVANLAKKINDQQNANSTIKNLSSLFNALSAYSKLKTPNFNMQPIKDLKEAVGNGISLGKAGDQMLKIRESLGGEWNSESAVSSMSNIASAAGIFKSEGTASTLTKVANAIDKYADSVKKLKKNGILEVHGGGMSLPVADTFTKVPVNLGQFGEKGEDIPAISSMKKQIDEVFANANENMSRQTSRRRLNLQFFAEKSKSDAGLDEAEKAAAPIAEGFETVGRVIGEVTTKTDDLKAKLVEVKDTITSVPETFNQSFSQFIHDAEWFSGRVPRLMSGMEDFGAQSNAIIPYGQSPWDWKPDFTMVGEAYENKDYQAIQEGTVVFTSVDMAAKAMGVSVKEAKKILEEVYNMVYSSSSPGTMPVFKTIEEAARSMGISVDEAKAKLQEAYSMVYGTSNMQKEVSEIGGAVMEAKEAIGTDDSFIPTDQFLETYSHIDYLKSKLEDMKSAFDERRRVGLLNPDEIDERVQKIVKLTNEIKKLEAVQNAVGKSTSNAGNSWKSFTKSIGNAFPFIKRLRDQLGRIVLRRALTAMIRQIADGFKEGVQNVYEYSKAVGTGFAPAMDSAASALAQMKNSIGAAVAPAIQALIPLLQTVVSWFITAVNYVNQFFALLNGQATWTRALPQTVTAFGKQEKAAKGAANAMKDLLADWDELNIIQSNTAGGAGGGATQAAEDYLSMFEEVDRFDDKVKDIMGFLYDNFDNLKRAAIDVGAAILGWKIGSTFTGLLGALGKIATTVAVIDLSLRLTDAFGKQFVNTGDIGWFIADALTGAIGPLLAGKAASSLLGAAWGSIAAGFTLMLEGEVNLKNARSAWAQRLVSQAQMLALLGSVEQGIGAALIAAGFSASAPVAIAIGGATALFAYTVNALASVNITGVKWGDDTMTPAQVEEYVKENMLGVDIDSTVKITKASIELAEGAETELSEKANGLIAPLNVLKLGVDVEGSLDQIKNGVFGEEGLLAQFKAYTSAQKELVNTAETYAPTIDDEGRNISGEIISDASNVWADLNGIMDDLGADLSRHLARSMDTTLSDELRQFELNAVEEITDTMIRVTLAGKRASASSDALTDLAFNLKEASAGTFEDILTVYSNYKDQLTEELQAIKKEEASSWANAAAMYEELAADALEKAGGDTNDSLYQEYKSKAEHAADEYKKIIEFIDSSVTKAVEDAAAPGKDLLRDTLLEKLQGVEELYDGRLALFAEGKVKSLPTGMAGGVKDKVMNAMQNLVLGGFGEGINDTNVEKLKGLYTDWLDSILEEFFPADYGIFKQAIESGVLNYTDFFDPETLFDSMTKTGHNSTLYRQMWDIMFNDLEYSGNVDLEARPIVDMEIVTQAGWVDENGKPLGDDYATVLSNLTSVGEKAHGYDMDYTENAVIHLTPILDDGTVLTPQELDDYISSIVKESLDTGNTIKEVDASHYSIVLGYDLVPEGMSLEDAYAEAQKWDVKLHEEQADTYDLQYEAMVQAEIEIANAESIKEEIRKQIEDALSGTNLDQSQEDALLNGLIGTFGSDFEDYILDTFEELEKNIGSNGGIAGKLNPRNFSAAGAFSDTRPSRSYVNGRPAAEVQMDQQSMTNAVESGTKKANAVEEDLIRQLVRVVEQIARKDFTVNVNPSAAWGGMNVRSGIARARVTGAIPMEE